MYIFVQHIDQSQSIDSFGTTESAVTHDFHDWAHRVDRFTLTRNRNYC